MGGNDYALDRVYRIWEEMIMQIVSRSRDLILETMRTGKEIERCERARRKEGLRIRFDEVSGSQQACLFSPADNLPISQDSQTRCSPCTHPAGETRPPHRQNRPFRCRAPDSLWPPFAASPCRTPSRDLGTLQKDTLRPTRGKRRQSGQRGPKPLATGTL